MSRQQLHVLDYIPLVVLLVCRFPYTPPTLDLDHCRHPEILGRDPAFPYGTALLPFLLRPYPQFH